MTLATLKGRLQTKLVTFAIVAPLAFLFAYLEDCTVYYTMLALMIVVGLTLEALWGIFINHEPGWLTILFAVIEFTLVFGIIKFFQLDIRWSFAVAEFHEGLRFYFITWSLIQLFLIYLLPVWRLSWLQNGSELW